MRLLHVIPALGPVYGGPSKLVPELARALVRAGVKVDIATTDANGDARLQVPLQVPVKEFGVTTYFFPRQRPTSYTFSWPLTRWLWRRVGDYDLVHITAVFSYSTLAAGWVARWLGRPFIVTPQGMLEPWCLRYKGWKKRPYFEIIERRTLGRATAIQALAAEEVQGFRSLGLSTPSFVLPNGFDPTEFESLPPREAFEALHPEVRGKKVVLFLGRIDPKKGLDLLVEAFGRMIQSGRSCQDIRLVIAGPDLIGYRQTVETIVNQAAIRDRVVFTGMLSGEQKLAALAAADVFVLSSRSEGLSIAILEALAAGCPVVITESCNFPQVGHAGVGKVIPATTDALVQALREMLADEQSRRAMAVKARDLVWEKFAWPAIAVRMVEVYEDVLRGTRQSAAWSS